MIRIIYSLLLLLSFMHVYLTAQSYQFSLSVGSDFYKVENMSAGFELKDLTEAKIIREGFSNPFMFGFGFGYSLSKKYILSLETDFNYQEYSVKYIRNYPKLTNPFYIKTSIYNVPWVRLGTSINLDYLIGSHKDIIFLLGGGVGIQVFAPAVSSQFLYETLVNKLSELDLSKDIDLDVYFSQQIRGGIKYKINNSNFNVSAVSSYIFVLNAKYEAPEKYFNFRIRIDYVL